MSPELEDLKGRLADITRLKEMPEVQRIFGKKFAALKEQASLQAVDRSLTPEKRAEWVEAYHQADGLISFLETEERAIRSKLAAMKK